MYINLLVSGGGWEVLGNWRAGRFLFLCFEELLLTKGNEKFHVMFKEGHSHRMARPSLETRPHSEQLCPQQGGGQQV